MLNPLNSRTNAHFPPRYPRRYPISLVNASETRRKCLRLASEPSLGYLLPEKSTFENSIRSENCGSLLALTLSCVFWAATPLTNILTLSILRPMKRLLNWGQSNNVVVCAEMQGPMMPEKSARANLAQTSKNRWVLPKPFVGPWYNCPYTNFT
jgi:hypothetical protein